MAQHQDQVERSVPNYSGYRALLPGLLGIGIVVAARLTGFLQPLEWAALDTALKWRLAEPTDEHVTIVGIDESDIQAVGTYPIPDEVLAQALQQLQDYGAEAIGLDIVRDVPVEPGHRALVESFQSMDNVIGAESVVPDRFGSLIAPPPALPSEHIGFVDNKLDADGNIRRSLLGAATTDGGYQFSMPIRLAMAYLEPDGLMLENGIRDPAAMRFGSVELARVSPNTGGYVRADAGGIQTLLNFRSGAEPFRRVSLMEVLQGEADPEWFRDRIVLVGVTASSAKDIVQSSAVRSSNPGLVFGVEVQAHATSQLVNAVLEGRSLLYTWSDGWEYAWIVVWGWVGIGISRRVQRLGRYFALVVGLSIGLLSLAYVGVFGGWWLPIVPALFAFWLNSVVFHVAYLYNCSLQSRIRDRQLVIEHTFTAIHNGPLQTLATLTRKVDAPDFSQEQLQQDLQNLNSELRSVYETIRREAMQDGREPSLYDLSLPLHELLYEVYSDTLQRDFPYFKDLKIHIVKFEPFDETSLSPELKRNLCQFLEEALCNVGKHAAGTKRLLIECRNDGTSNVIRVEDNGVSVGMDARISEQSRPSEGSSAPPGWGTRQAKTLARQLGGTFERWFACAEHVSPKSAKGMVCELRWQARRSFEQGVQHLVQTLTLAVFGKPRD